MPEGLEEPATYRRAGHEVGAIVVDHDLGDHRPASHAQGEARPGHHGHPQERQAGRRGQAQRPGPSVGRHLVQRRDDERQQPDRALDPEGNADQPIERDERAGSLLEFGGHERRHGGDHGARQGHVGNRRARQ